MCGCTGTRPCTCHWDPFNDNPDDGVDERVSGSVRMGLGSS